MTYMFVTCVCVEKAPCSVMLLSTLSLWGLYWNLEPVSLPSSYTNLSISAYTTFRVPGCQVTPEFLCRHWEFELRPSCLCLKSPTEWREDIIGATKLRPGIEFSGLKHREPFILGVKFTFLFLYRCLALALGLTADRPFLQCVVSASQIS